MGIYIDILRDFVWFGAADAEPMKLPFGRWGLVAGGIAVAGAWLTSSTHAERKFSSKVSTSVNGWLVCSTFALKILPFM
jgi:hypothetical protein